MDSSQYDLLAKYTRALSIALEYRHFHTRLHSDRVRDLALELGRCCGLEGEMLQLLGIAASLHDIGKLGVPDSILSKPGRLDDSERDAIKRHPVYGEEILIAMDLPGSADVAKVIRHHHEHFDGSGYPDRLAGDGIPIASRIIGIVDSFDAMAEERPYHPPKGPGEIIAILNAESGTKHDPVILQQFFVLIEAGRTRGGNGGFPT